MSYFKELEKQKNLLRDVLIEKGVKEEYLTFELPAELDKAPRVPTDVRSEFLANRAMGDWAENILADAIRRAMPSCKVVHYGESSTIAAGDEGFKEFYLERWREVGLYGKRPDLLVMPEYINCEQDVSGMKTLELMDIVKKADFSIEVRSSKFEALTYMKVRQEEYGTTGKKPSQMTPSFTVKIEDLLIVYRWLSRHHCPQLYCQVFFDSIYAINFLNIFRIIASGTGFKIETPAKSQLKSTIMLPITFGKKVADFTKPPSFEAELKITRLGRHDAFVKPVGGDVKLDHNSLLEVASFAACSTILSTSS